MGDFGVQESSNHRLTLAQFPFYSYLVLRIGGIKRSKTQIPFRLRSFDEAVVFSLGFSFH